MPISISRGPFVIGNGAKMSVATVAPEPFIATTWNPSDIGDDTVLSNGNLTAQCGDGSGYSSIRTVDGMTSPDQRVWEITVDSYALGGTSVIIGYGTSAASLNDYPGHFTTSLGWVASGVVFYNNGVIASFGSYTVSDVVSIEFDAGTNTGYFYKNGVLAGSVTQALTGGSTIFPMLSNGNSTGRVTVTANFGATPFVVTPQSGFTGIPG